MHREGYRDDVTRSYAGYWNAFECCVDAVCVLCPPPTPLNAEEKQDAIDRFVAAHPGRLTVESVTRCYHDIVNPGFKGKATHALRQLPPALAEKYIVECFKGTPKEDGLYQLRNAIKHGSIDAGNAAELMRIKEKQVRLWIIVFQMLSRILPVPRPAAE